MNTIRRFGTALLGVLVASVTSLPAQNRPLAKAKVPFAFQLGNKLYPAGVYTMSMERHMFLHLQGQHVAGVFLVSAEEDGRQTGSAHLTFLRQAGVYQLRDVWVPEGELHVRCPTAKRIHRQELAQDAEPETLVQVALQAGAF